MVNMWETSGNVGGLVPKGAGMGIIDRAKEHGVEEFAGLGWIVTTPDGHNELCVTLTPAKQYECDCGRQQGKVACVHIIAVTLYRTGRHPSRHSTDATKGDAHAEVVEGEGGGAALVPPSPVLADGPYRLDDGNARPPSPADFTIATGTTHLTLPAKFEHIFPHQYNAVQEAVEHYRSGLRLVFIDAPTGSGKTFIAELIRRATFGAEENRTLYVCSSKALQDQFATDFTYAKVLKGRSNYLPTDAPPGEDVTCADCTKQRTPEGYVACDWCQNPRLCPYEMAKDAALESELAVINTSYLLTEANRVGKFSGVDLAVMDECDILEKEVMSATTFELGARMQQKLGVTPPKKGSHYTTIAGWLSDELLPAAQTHMKKESAHLKQQDMWGADPKKIKAANAARRFLEEVGLVIDQWGEGGEGWVRDNSDEMRFCLKPVHVDKFGPGMLWQHSNLWLPMSATIISSEEMVRSLGWEDDYATVIVPSTFPPEIRPIYLAGVAWMSYKQMEASYENTVGRMIDAVEAVIRRHPGERVLVHAVSYKLTTALGFELRRRFNDRNICFYTSGQYRDAEVKRYLATEGSVIIAPSLDRGIDFAGDACRAQVIAKTPFQSLSDDQVSTRANEGREGKLWYAVNTIRTIVQMTGRGVRSADDYCATYILDEQFTDRLWKERRDLFPQWWKEAVDRTFNKRELLR
jgi:Rad3-related DNA helicase